MCYIFSESADTLAAGFGPQVPEILGGIANYTDLMPVMQFSKVVVG